MYLFLGALLALLGVGGYISYPCDEEMMYVYERSGNKEELIKRYEEMAKNSDLPEEMEAKYIGLLLESDYKKGLAKSEKLLNTKDAQKLIEKALEVTLVKKDFEEHLKWLEFAYQKSGDTKYLQKKLELLSFLNSLDGLKDELKRMYELKRDIALLETLYGMGEKEFALNELRSRIDELSPIQKRKLFNFYVWSGDIKSAFWVLDSKIGFESLSEAERKSYLEYALFLGEIEKAKATYDAKSTNDEAELQEMANFYDYIGEPLLVAKTYQKMFALFNKIEYLENILDIYLAMGNEEMFLRTQKEIIFATKDERALNDSVLALVDKYKNSEAEKLLLEYFKKDSFKKGDPLLMLSTLYMMEGREEMAFALYKKYKPSELSSDELYMFLNKKSTNEDDIPYLIALYEKSKDEEALKRLFDYYLKKGGVAEARWLYLSLKNERINAKNIDEYLKLLPKEQVEPEFERIAGISFDDELLLNIADQFLALQKEAKANMILARLTQDLNPKESKNIRLLRVYAYQKIEKREFEAALIALERLRELDSDKRQVFIDFAFYYEAKDELYSALKAYKEALTLDESSKEVQEKVDELENEYAPQVTVKRRYADGMVQDSLSGEIVLEPFRVGFSSILYGDYSGGYLYIRDLGAKKYTIEAGKDHLKAYYGDKLKIGVERVVEIDDKDAFDTRLIKSGLFGTYLDSFGDFTVYGTLGRAKYDNKNGYVGAANILDIGGDYRFSERFSLTGGYSYREMMELDETKAQNSVDDTRGASAHLVFSEKGSFWSGRVLTGAIYDNYYLNQSYAIEALLWDSFGAEARTYEDKQNSEYKTAFEIFYKYRF